MQKNLIAFDMDGVLIDVSGSYRDTVRRTAHLFLKGAAAWEALPEPLFSLTDLSKIKQRGGLNNDWDLTYFVLKLLFSGIDCPDFPDGKDAWQTYRRTIVRCDVSALPALLTSSDSPLMSVLQKTARPDHPFIRKMHTGDVGSGNIIKQIFQEVYLGRDLFESTYKIAARKHMEDGYITREKLMVDKSFIAELARDNILAMATGRPKAEADYALDFFGLRKYFTSIYTLDECLIEEEKIHRLQGRSRSLSKPHPWMLDAIAAENAHRVRQFFYVGDMPDDMLAAKNSTAGFKGIGLLCAAPDKAYLKKEFMRSGADYIIEDHQEIRGIVGQPS
ncbi:MAG: HAD hydrolase-like protein [Deltaproteobacteria bacterium]|nr:HAD hydrolase-like protein [Deltaproteobacteria bacterium]